MTMTTGAAAIDWTRPWLAPYRGTGEAAAAAIAAHPTTAAALQAAAAGLGTAAPPPLFVAHERLPPGRPYEAHIFETNEVPTRDNLHDFFNGLVWLAFPASKRRLNGLQAAEIARHGIGATRGPLRDALTLFDENGAVLEASPVLWEALAARDWRRLFITERARWQEARLLVFGHALLEKLVSPRKAATAHVLVAASGAATGSVAHADAAIAAALNAAHLSAKPFLPLPVLGVPGWCAENENFSFYDDSDVFRARRATEQPIQNPALRQRHTA